MNLKNRSSPMNVAINVAEEYTPKIYSIEQLVDKICVWEGICVR